MASGDQRQRCRGEPILAQRGRHLRDGLEHRRRQRARAYRRCRGKVLAGLAFQEYVFTRRRRRADRDAAGDPSTPPPAMNQMAVGRIATWQRGSNTSPNRPFFRAGTAEDEIISSELPANCSVQALTACRRQRSRSISMSRRCTPTKPDLLPGSGLACCHRLAPAGWPRSVSPGRLECEACSSARQNLADMPRKNSVPTAS